MPGLPVTSSTQSTRTPKLTVRRCWRRSWSSTVPRSAAARTTSEGLDAEHGANEFLCVAGETAIGAKGTSWQAVRRVIREADPSLTITSGIVSGEGVIYHVRDPREKRRKAKGKEALSPDCDEDGYITVIEDEGVQDKRLLIYEPEFARVLTAVDRRDNTTSSVLRQLWETGDVRTLAKNSHDKATGAHIAIVAHVTPHELRTRLGATEMMNGFANRFCFACSKRSKLLSQGGSVPSSIIVDLAARVAETLEAKRPLLGMAMTTDAQDLWNAEYPRLRTPPDGIDGAAMARAAQHTLRFAVIYALLDERADIHGEHLTAALAFWAFCHRAAELLFRGATGDHDADQVLDALARAAPAGLNRREIYEMLHGNYRRDRVDIALALLLIRDLAFYENEQTAGRPGQRWHTRGGAPS